jgi:hypothetical protein
VTLLEERTTRLSLMVLLLDGSAPSRPVTREVQLSLKNSPKTPMPHRLGYWLFLDLPQGNQTLIWGSKWYESGERAVNIDTLPRLRPLIEVRLTPLLKITTATLAQGKVGEAYRQVVAVSGAKAPLRFEGTALPAGLNMDRRSGAIAGTPTAEGQSTVTVTVTDGKGSRAEKNYALKIVN